jgi:acylphosphatase
VSGVAATKRLHARVHGRVQGVGFRASTQEEGVRLQLGGWVRNLVDGAVEVEAEGDTDALERLLAFLRRGPATARVDAVSVEWFPSAGLDRPFAIKNTPR